MDTRLTPASRPLREMTGGYREDPAEILSRTFEESSDELIVLRDIDFHSTCEHHLCMGCRGVKLPGTEMVTSAMPGSLRDDAVTREEFLRLSGVEK